MQLQMIHRAEPFVRFEITEREKLPKFGTLAENADTAADILDRAGRALDRLGVEYYVADGSLLGPLRQETFIPADNDLDINLPREALNDDLFEAFETEGLTRFKQLFVDGERVNAGFYLGNLWLDLAGMEHIDGWAYTHSKFRDGITTYKTPIVKPQRVQLAGVEVWIPEQAEDYIEYCYGPDWREPVKFWDNTFNNFSLDSVSGDANTLTVAMRRWLRVRGHPSVYRHVKMDQTQKKPSEK